ncbi:MAG: DNA replication/repair protein RecF [Actinobacteria bacterium]|nr:DNA replication/repair protein RecF [Actinomycetota bacterium]
MLLRRVELRDVRSYTHATLDLSAGVTVLVGANAQGKTNLVEAIHRAAVGSSHRVASDAPLVRAGADAGYVRLLCDDDAGRRRTLELALAPGRGTRVRVDGNDVGRASDALGVLRVVLFAPEDVALIRGDPAGRRGFLDELLSQRRPAYAASKSEYDRVLRQRNQLLKQLRGLSSSATQTATATLDAWTDQLVNHGTQLLAARIAVTHALAGPTDTFYRDLADRPDPIRLAYESSVGVVVEGRSSEGVPDPVLLAEAFRDALTAVASDERHRGVTLVGPHRDDLLLAIGSLEARTHASQGEAWSLALALKLATYDVLAEVGDRPVVALDDVFAELDEERRAQLARACERWEQVIVTAAVEADVPLRGAMIDVVRGPDGTALYPRPRAAEGGAA